MLTYMHSYNKIWLCGKYLAFFYWLFSMRQPLWNINRRKKHWLDPKLRHQIHVLSSHRPSFVCNIGKSLRTLSCRLNCLIISSSSIFPFINVMGAATIDTNTRSCPPAHWKAEFLSFPTAYNMPILFDTGMLYTVGKLSTWVIWWNNQNSCPPDFGLAAPLNVRWFNVSSC